jgi:AraC family transcriptional activator of pobA
MDFRSRTTRAGAVIPSFSLYGEVSAPGQEMLHIEEVHARSLAHHWEIRPHIHHGLYQVLWLFCGRAEVALDERLTHVEGPAAIVVPPGVVHGFRFDPETDGKVLTLSARFLVEGEFEAVGAAFRQLFAAPGILSWSPVDVVVQRLQALFHELAQEFAWPGGCDTPVVGWLARSVVWRLAQARSTGREAGSGEKAGKAGSHQALFTRFLLLVEQHVLEHWPMERYASHLGLSTQRLNRLVFAESGRSALELVHDRLTREACRRLIYVAAPAASLALELGFNDPAYFSRFFKRRMGVSPQAYRRAHQGLGA